MKNKYLSLALLTVAAGGMALLTGCVVEPDGRVFFQPVVVAAPPPVVVVAPPPAPVYVPDDYVWDGYEYVGVVGNQYYYLGSGNVWLICDPVRLGRYHGWVGGHPDWHSHAIRNDRYRNDSRGHYQPRRDHR